MLCVPKSPPPRQETEGLRCLRDTTLLSRPSNDSLRPAGRRTANGRPTLSRLSCNGENPSPPTSPRGGGFSAQLRGEFGARRYPPSSPWAGSLGPPTDAYYSPLQPLGQQVVKLKYSRTPSSRQRPKVRAQPGDDRPTGNVSWPSSKVGVTSQDCGRTDRVIPRRLGWHASLRLWLKHVSGGAPKARARPGPAWRPRNRTTSWTRPGAGGRRARTVLHSSVRSADCCRSCTSSTGAALIAPIRRGSPDLACAARQQAPGGGTTAVTCKDLAAARY